MAEQGSGTLLLHGAILGLATAVAAMALSWFGLLASLEALTFDIRARLLARPGPATESIKLILLDQKSLDWAAEEFGLGWPWPREVYAPLVDFCRQAGARVLAFDVVYTEPSVYGVNDDAALARAVENMDGAVMPLSLSWKDGTADTWPVDEAPEAPQPSGLDAWLEQGGERITRPLATFPIPELSRAADLLGNVAFDPDPDTVFRHLPPFLVFDGRAVPSLALAAFLAANPGTGMALDKDGLAIGPLHVPLDQNGLALLNYRPKGSYQAFAAAAVVQSALRLAEGGETTPTLAIDPAEFKDAYVFFGFSAMGLLDLRHTPLGGVTPGVVLHATALDNILSGDFMTRSAPWAVALLALCLSVGGACGLLLSRGPGLGIAVHATALILPLVLAAWAYRSGVWLDLVALEAAALMSSLVAGTYKYATEGRQKRFIKSAFKQYLSPEVISQLLAHPERLSLGGERRELSIYFSDLAGFTAISESLEPETLTTLLNDYLTAMTDIIHEEGGTVDKYEGDAIIAFWNAPLDQPDHAKRAVRAAVRCQQRLAELRPEFVERTGKPFHMRVGLNTGPAVVGNLGSHTRFDYTMLGDAVNLAARLEGVNKVFFTSTLLSETTHQAQEGHLPCREVGRIRVVGKREAVRVFQPLDEVEASQAARDLFSEGLKLYYAGDFARARERFLAASGDLQARAYAEECVRLLADPPEQWDGVWVLSKK